MIFKIIITKFLTALSFLQTLPYMSPCSPSNWWPLLFIIMHICINIEIYKYNLLCLIFCCFENRVCVCVCVFVFLCVCVCVWVWVWRGDVSWLWGLAGDISAIGESPPSLFFFTVLSMSHGKCHLSRLWRPCPWVGSGITMRLEVVWRLLCQGFQLA